MPRLAPPQGVLFDIGDTILIEQSFDLEAGIAAAMGQPADVPALANMFRTELGESHASQHELSLAEWLKQRVPALAAELVDDIEDRIWPAVAVLTPTPGIERVLSRLAFDGVRMAAVSNAPFSSRILTWELNRHSLATYFQCVITSADLGLRKPHPDVFRTALRRLGVSAEQAWFVGDTPREDIAGATTAGLTCFLLCPRRPPNGVPDSCDVVGDWAEFFARYVGTSHAEYPCSGAPASA